MLSYLSRVCGECSVPEVLSREARGCLYLLPMRIFEGDQAAGVARTLYHCRTFYDLNPKRPATTARWHVPGLCSWWFPRPHSFLPPDTEWHTERAMGLYLGELEAPVRTPFYGSRETGAPDTWWERFKDWLGII